MNRRKRKVLSLIIVFALIIGFLPTDQVLAATSYTFSKSYISPTELPANITVTADASIFTAGEVYPSAVDSTANGTALSVVSSTDTTVVFKLPSGLAKEQYEIRIGDPSAPGGYYSVGNIIVDDPSLTTVGPLVNLPFGYDTVTSLTITGRYVNFQTGQTVVEVLSSNTVVQTPVITSIADNSTTRDVTFGLETGLGAGNYDVRITTGDEVLKLVGAVVVRNAASIGLESSLSLNEGYNQLGVNIDGTNTGFSGLTTVTITDEAGDDTNAATGINVVDTTNLSFTLSSGLSVGTYTITVKTGVEEASSIFAVLSPSAVIKDENNTNVVTSLGRSGDTANFKIIGTNTDFVNGTSVVNLFNSVNNPVIGKISSMVVDSSTQITLTLDQNITAGSYKLQVITGSQTVETGTFTVVEPSITSITYNSIVYNAGKLGDGYPAFQVTIVGDPNSSFGSNSTAEIVGQSKVSSISSADAQQLTFTIDTGLLAGNYQIKVDMDGNPATTFDTFTVTEVPDFSFTVISSSVDSINPKAIVNTVSTNKTITVTGVNTHFAIVGATITVAIKNGAGQVVGDVTNITVIDNDTLTFDLLPTSINNEGLYSVEVTVTKGSYTETVTLSNSLSVTSSGISDVTPNYIYEDLVSSGKTLVITGFNTDFDTNDVVKINGTVMSGVTITNTTQLSVDIPTNLSAGSHNITIIDGASTYTSSFEVRGTRTMTLSGYSTPIDYVGEIVTVTTANIDFNSNTPTVTLIHPGGSRQVIASTIENQDTVTFNLPSDLSKGTYTVELTFASGDHSSKVFTDPFNITNRYNSLYFTVDGSVTNSLTVTEGTSDVTLAVLGTLISGGDDEDVTSKDIISVTDTSVATVIGNTLSFAGDGTTTVTATYDEQTVVLNITVQPLYSDIYIAVDGNAVENLTKNVGDSAVILTVMGNPSAGGAAVDITGLATLNLISGTSVSLSGSNLSFSEAGSSVISASYESITKELNVTVNTAGINVPPSGGGFFPPILEETEEELVLEDKESIVSETNQIKEQLESGSIDTKVAANKIIAVAEAAKGYIDNEETTVEEALLVVKDIITLNAGNLIKKDLKGKDTQGVKDKILALTEKLIEKSGSIEISAKTTDVSMISDALTTAINTANELKKELKANGLTELQGKMNERIVIKANSLEEVLITEDIIKELAKNDFDLKVEASGVSFVMNASNSITEDVNIMAKEVSDKEKYTSNKESYQNQVGKVYDLDVTGNKGNVEVMLPVPIGKESSEKLTIYVYNEETNKWIFVRSRIVDGKIIFKAPHFSIYTVMENKITFDDVDVHWAKDSIEVLAAKQIISGKGNNKFDANGFVTRAEFAKMIVSAIGYEESAKNLFSDVPEDAWYTDYVAQAMQAGIVSGVGDNKFAPKDNITREQMASMIARSYKYVKGSELIGSSVSFTDKNNISNWAKEAIEGASYKGIISGFPNNSFGPKENATRAQAAKMIKKLLEIIE